MLHSRTVLLLGLLLSFLSVGAIAADSGFERPAPRRAASQPVGDAATAQKALAHLLSLRADLFGVGATLVKVTRQEDAFYIFLGGTFNARARRPAIMDEVESLFSAALGHPARQFVFVMGLEGFFHSAEYFLNDRPNPTPEQQKARKAAWTPNLQNGGRRRLPLFRGALGQAHRPLAGSRLVLPARRTSAGTPSAPTTSASGWLRTSPTSASGGTFRRPPRTRRSDGLQRPRTRYQPTRGVGRLRPGGQRLRRNRKLGQRLFRRRLPELLPHPPPPPPAAATRPPGAPSSRWAIITPFTCATAKGRTV